MPVRKCWVAWVALPMTLAFGANGAMAAALDKNLSRQYLVQPMLGLFEMQPSEPLQALSLIVEPRKVDMTQVEPSLLKRLFRALGSAVGPDAALADTPPTIGTTKGQGLMAQDADPNFELWQKKADEKLKLEQTLRQTPPHRLALQHPDQYIVVCEAGCRKDTEEIVYAVAKVEASAPVTRLEPSSAGTPNAGGDQTAEGRIQEPDAILCVAGCYESPKVHAARQKSASIEAPAIKTAQTSRDPRETARHYTASRTASVHDSANAVKVAHAAPSKNALTRLTHIKTAQAPVMPLAKIRPWQTRTIYATPVKTVQALAKPQTSPHSVARVTVAGGRWRTKIVFAATIGPVSAQLHESRLERVKHYRQALLPMRKARLVQYAVSETRF